MDGLLGRGVLRTLLTVYLLYRLAGIACCLERRTRDRKVASSNPCRSGGRMFFSRVNFVRWLVACKRPRSFCQKCRWQVTPKHAYTLDLSKSEWADYAAVQAECGNLSGNELIRNSSGNTWSQSSQLVEPLWTDPGLKSKISLRELIFTLKKKREKKRRRGMNRRTFSQNLRTRRKSHHHHLMYAPKPFLTR